MVRQFNQYSVHDWFNFVVPCPEIINPPVHTVVKPGETTTMNCFAYSSAAFQYKWKRHQQQDLPSEATASVKVNHETTVVHSELTIRKTRPSDEGWYCCVATNECGYVEECTWLEIDSELK